MLALSWLAAIVACLGYGVGSVLQSVGAQRTAHIAGASGVALILVQLPYLLGLGLDLVAFGANVVALQRLPLFLVQAILTGSVGVTAVIAALRGTRLGWKDWTSLAVLLAGLVMLSVSAVSQSGVLISEQAQYVILATAVLPLLVGLLARRLRGRASGIAYASAAGLAYSGVAVAARGLSGAMDRSGPDRMALDWSLLASPLLWTIVVQGVIGTIFFALSLQRASVTSVTAITFMVEMVIPSIIGLLIFGDAVHPGLGPLAIVGFALSILGTVSLSRFAA